jgi:hypothetical protein
MPSFAHVPKKIYFYQLFPTFEEKNRQNVKKIDHFPSHFYSELRLAAFFQTVFFFFAVCIDSKKLSPFNSKSLLECSRLTHNQEIEEKTLILIHVCFSPFLG